jgi:hypothetical protein
MNMSIVDEINLTTSSVGVAGVAAQDEDWPRAQQALLDAQGRIASLLREVELKIPGGGQPVADPDLPPEPNLPIKAD